MSFKHITQITVVNFQKRGYEIGSFTSLRKVFSLDHQNGLSGYHNVALMFSPSGMWASGRSV